jgi:hypothetical protein
VTEERKPPWERGLVKILIPARDPDEDFEETIWAKPLGEGRYQIENIPTQSELNYGDVVLCDAPEEEGGFPEVIDLLEDLGHAKLFLEVPKETIERDEVKSMLTALFEAALGFEHIGAGAVVFCLRSEIAERWIERLDQLEDAGLIRFDV